MTVLLRQLQRPISTVASKILSARKVTTTTATTALSTLCSRYNADAVGGPVSPSSSGLPACSHTTTTSRRRQHRSFATTRQDASGRFGHYQKDYDASLHDPRHYWLQASSELDWHTPPTYENTLRQTHPDYSDKMHQWFTDGKMNTCYNCLDRHVHHPTNSRANQKALVYDSPVTNTKRHYTYKELLDEVSQFAAGLSNLGVNVGDTVIIYMPMIPEAIVAMLACARIGAVHSVVFGGFAAKELASRVEDCRPKVVVSASCGVLPGGRIVEYKPLLEEALEIAQCGSDVRKCVIVQREGVAECELREGKDVSYRVLMEGVTEKMDAVPLPSTHPHYILYTSGTTGMPKGVVHDTGGYATAMKWSMSKFYDCEPGDVFFAASDIGWVVGHSYTVYGPLLHGCTTILYEGKPVGTPDAGAYWRIIEEHAVNTLFSAPTAFRAMRQADPNGLLTNKYDLSSLRATFVAGERSDPSTLHWIEDILKEYDIPAIDHWWQTELAFPGAGNALGLGKITTRYGACAAAVPGYDIRALDNDGNEVPPTKLGSLAIKLPLPPGTLPTLYNDDDRYVKEYLTKFPGYYDTMDAGAIDDDGYISILSRTDDIISTAGYRLSTGAMEEILLEHPNVTDCAVVGVKDELKGEVPMGFVVVSNDEDEEKREGRLICDELVASVRKTLGVHANLNKIAVVKALPKTRSGKVLRGTMRKIANGEEYVVTPTIEDPNVFTDLKPAIERLVNDEQ